MFKQFLGGGPVLDTRIILTLRLILRQRVQAWAKPEDLSLRFLDAADSCENAKNSGTWPPYRTIRICSRDTLYVYLPYAYAKCELTGTLCRIWGKAGDP